MNGHQAAVDEYAAIYARMADGELWQAVFDLLYRHERQPREARALWWPPFIAAKEECYRRDQLAGATGSRWLACLEAARRVAHEKGERP